MVSILAVILQSFGALAAGFSPIYCVSPASYGSVEEFAKNQLGAELAELGPSMKQFLMAKVGSGPAVFTEFVQANCRHNQQWFADGDATVLLIKGNLGFVQSRDEFLGLDEFMQSYGRWFKNELLTMVASQGWEQHAPGLLLRLQKNAWSVASDDFNDQVNLLGMDQDQIAQDTAWSQLAYRWDTYPSQAAKLAALQVIAKHGVAPLFVSEAGGKITLQIHEVTRAWTGVDQAERFYIQTHLPVIAQNGTLNYGLPRDQEHFMLANPQAFPETSAIKAKLAARLKKTCSVLKQLQPTKWSESLPAVINELAERLWVDEVPQVIIQDSLPSGETAGLEDKTLIFAQNTINERLAELPQSLKAPWLTYLVTQEFTHYLQKHMTDEYEMNFRIYNSPHRAYQMGGITGHQHWYASQPIEADAQGVALELARACFTAPEHVVELR